MRLADRNGHWDVIVKTLREEKDFHKQVFKWVCRVCVCMWDGWMDGYSVYFVW